MLQMYISRLSGNHMALSFRYNLPLHHLNPEQRHVGPSRLQILE